METTNALCEKEETKLESVEHQVKSNNDIITEIYQFVSDIETNLGECNAHSAPKDKPEEATSRLIRLKDNLYSTHVNLLELRDRLGNIQRLF